MAAISSASASASKHAGCSSAAAAIGLLSACNHHTDRGALIIAGRNLVGAEITTTFGWCRSEASLETEREFEGGGGGKGRPRRAYQKIERATV